jgi:hypothetical protein
MIGGRTGRAFVWLALGLPLGLLQACAPEGPAASHARLFASDLSGGAKNCTISKVNPTDGQTSAVTMQVGNDGGWCGISLQRGGSPYSTGLVTERSAHGSVVIHPVGDNTRIDYTPARGYRGTDTFAVKLIPGDAILQVSVTVS